MDVALRDEWLHARARHTHYKEEIGTLNEEQQRTFVFLKKNALRWNVLLAESVKRTDNSSLSDGLQVHVQEQAALQRQLASKYHAVWYGGCAILTTAKMDEGTKVDNGNGSIWYTFANNDSDGECYNEGKDNDSDIE